MRLPPSLCKELRQADRWRVEDMLMAQPDLRRHDWERDLDLWRRLYLPTDLVRIGDVICEAAAASPKEICWGCTWGADGVPRKAVAHCLAATDVLRGASWAEPMSRREACEAVLGRMKHAALPLLLVVEDGQEGLEVWVDAGASEYPSLISCGRCPGSRNQRTGRTHRVVWAYEGLWAGWTMRSGLPRPTSVSPIG
jgi:hypothetical protein